MLPLAYSSGTHAPSFSGTVIADAFSSFFNIVYILAAIFTIFISIDYLKKVGAERGEYYYIVLFATLGMMVMTASNDLINVYVGLELMALSFYVLVAFRTDNRRSSEGALKYFVLGALSSGILVYGISFAYGVTGTTNLLEIAEIASDIQAKEPFLILAIALIAVGFAFKIALFPFHIWAPDAYEGAPTPVTALLSIGSKSAAFAVFMRILIVALPAFRPQWSKVLWGLSAATMIFASVVAISQQKIIRMLAYSSIAHAGIILIGLLSFNNLGVSGILYYLLVYTFMNMGAFAVATMCMREDGRGELISDYRGLYKRHPWLAFLMSLFLVSLAGIPPTGGFAAKFFILASAVNAGYYVLAAIGVLATVISLYFYVRVIFYMYLKEPEEGELASVPASSLYYIVLFVTAVGTVFLGIYPAPFMEMAVEAIKPLLI